MKQTKTRTEAERIAALRAFGVLDTPPEPAFDRLTALASDIFKTPISLVSLVDEDRLWFKSKQGLEICSTDRDQTFCAQAIEMGPDAVMVVEDAAQDPRFAQNPQVAGGPEIRFYAGATLTTRDGYNLGTLCVIDTKPRPRPTASKLNKLKTLAQIAVDALELNQLSRLAGEKQRLLEIAERLAGAGHWRRDLRTDRITWSEALYRLHGVDRATYDPTIVSPRLFYSVDERARLAEHLAALIENKGSFELQLVLNRADGEPRDVIMNAVCELDSQGEVVALFGLLRDITDHARSLRAAQRREARYRLLADHAADVITRYDFKGAGSFVSSAIERLLGFTPSETEGRDLPSFLHPDDVAHTLAAFEAMSRGCVEQTIEHRSMHKDGHYVWVESHLRLVTDDQGLPFEIVAVSRDISDRKALELETLAARDEARALAQRALLAEDIAGVGYWRIDLLSGNLTLSPKMYEIYGLDPAEPPKAGRMMRMIHPDDQAWVSARIEERLRTGEADYNVVNRIVRVDGQTRYVSGSSIIERDAEGRMITLVGTVMDITERRQAEISLLERESRYRLLAENATDMISEFSLDTTINFITPACRAVLGYEPEELIGRKVLEFLHPDDQASLMSRYLAFVEGPPVTDSPTFQYRVRRKDGAWVWLEGRPRVIRDPETGVSVSMQDVVRDITARKAAEVELRQARAEAEAAATVKSEFLANMSHELRTPLTAVLGFTRLIEIQPELSETTRQYTHRASNAGKALLATVNDILDFSKLEAGQVEINAVAASPAQVAIEALDLFSLQAKEKGLRLEVDGLEALPAMVTLDPERLRQVLLNFLGNAVKFTEAGVVTLAAAYDPVGQRLTLSVTDSGPGVAPDRQARLFQRFSQVDASSTRKHGGTGLGLAICKGLVEAMGGEIGVESEAGRGARFWFTIPAPTVSVPDSESGLMTTSTPAPLLPRGCRVLLADDNASNRELVRAVLEVFDVELNAVADGLAALAAANAAPYDVILMDLRMPGLDGASAARRIRVEDGPNASAPILAFSAEAVLQPEEGLFDGVVSKPLSALDLISAMAGAMAGESLHDAA